MKIDGWKFYNHAAVPTSAPHEAPNLAPIQDRTIWEMGGGPLLARWTTNWDCGHETNWWYVIKDTPFDINSIKSKRRYEINKGIKNFEVREIDCRKYKQEIYEIKVEAMKSYPLKYQVEIDKEKLFQGIDRWNYYKSYGAFFRETGRLCGYSLLRREGKYVNFALQYVIPQYERLAVNAALVYSIVSDHDEFFRRGGYICDGSRTVVHESAFQDYLEKYFEFRKAYCKLHIKYRPMIGMIVKCFKPFKNVLKSSNSALLSQICGLLEMEEATKDE